MRIKNVLIVFICLTLGTLVALLAAYIADVCSKLYMESETFAHFMYIAMYAFLAIIIAAQFFRIYMEHK